LKTQLQKAWYTNVSGIQIFGIQLFIGFLVKTACYISTNYSQHLKTGPSGIRMVNFPTLFWSGFQMITKWLTIGKPDQKFFNF
jgi:hypothetical protein